MYTRAWWMKRDPHRVRHATCVVLALDPGMATPLMPQIVSNFPCCHQATGPPFHRPLLARPAVPFSLPRSLVRQLLPWASLASREGVASPDPPQDKAGRCTANAVSPRPRLRPHPTYQALHRPLNGSLKGPHRASGSIDLATSVLKSPWGHAACFRPRAVLAPPLFRPPAPARAGKCLLTLHSSKRFTYLSR